MVTYADVADRYGRWAHALDAGRPDLLLRDFADDPVLWVSTRGTYRGRDEIAAILTARAGQTLHVVSNVVTEPPDRAHALLHVVDLATGAVIGRARYDDALADDGRWQIKAIEFLWQAPAYAAVNDSLRRPDHGSPNPVGPLRR